VAIYSSAPRASIVGPGSPDSALFTCPACSVPELAIRFRYFVRLRILPASFRKYCVALLIETCVYLRFPCVIFSSTRYDMRLRVNMHELFACTLYILLFLFI